MKVTKAAAIEKAKQAGFDLKVDKKTKTITGTRKKKDDPVEVSGDHKELMSAVKSVLTQNKDMMSMLSSSMSTDQVVESLAKMVAQSKDAGKNDEIESLQAKIQHLTQAQPGKILRGKVNTRDADGLMETFTIKVVPVEDGI